MAGGSQGDRQWQTFSRNVKCSAHRTNGEPCQRYAMRGQRVCYVHGGASPQARRGARQRLLELAEPAVEALHRALDSGDTRSVVAAAREILNRSGYPSASRLEIEQHEQTISESHAAQLVDVVRGSLMDLGMDLNDERVQSVVRDNLQRVAEGRAHVRALPPAPVTVDAENDAVEDAEVVEGEDVT